MKTLFLTRRQAEQLAEDLLEYAKMKDSHGRELFKGFKISLGDLFSEKLCPDQGFEMTPISEFTQIDPDDIGD